MYLYDHKSLYNITKINYRYLFIHTVSCESTCVFILLEGPSSDAAFSLQCEWSLRSDGGRGMQSLMFRQLKLSIEHLFAFCTAVETGGKST